MWEVTIIDVHKTYHILFTVHHIVDYIYEGG